MGNNDLRIALSPIPKMYAAHTIVGENAILVNGGQGYDL